MRYELEPNQFVIRVYNDNEVDNYHASALIRTYGDVALVSSISNPSFFEAVMQNLDTILKDLGVKTLEGYMSKTMARALRMNVKGRAKYEEKQIGECSGRQMPWVVISKV